MIDDFEDLRERALQQQKRIEELDRQPKLEDLWQDATHQESMDE